MKQDVRKRARLAEVAEHANVSRGLVSRMLNGDATLKIKPETRERILESVRILGYAPQSAAAALRRSKTSTIGLVINKVANPMYVDMISAAQKAATEAENVLLLVDAAELEENGRLFREIVSARRVDGLLLQGGYGSGADLLLPYSGLIPSVIFNASGSGAAPGIRLQDTFAAQIATRHLLELGHTRLAYVSGAAGETSDSRRHGFESVLGSADGTVLEGGWSADDCHAAVVDHYRSGGTSTAILAVNSAAAVGVVSAIHFLGLRIPTDVSVVGIHDTLVAPHLTPPLTTVRLALAELGREAVRLLIQHIDEPVTGDFLVDSPAPELISRESTSPPPRRSFLGKYVLGRPAAGNIK